MIVDAYGSPTIQNDLATFDSAFGIAPPPSFTIFCPAACPPFNPNDKEHGVIGWSQETSLDVEYAHAMAPGANIVLVVPPSSSGDSVNVAEAAAIKKYPGSIMSQSFGSGEFLITGNRAQIIQAHKNYEDAQNAGITVLASAGDSGAANSSMLGSKVIIGSEANASFPASDPLVTGVGGTEGLPYPGGLANCSTTTCTGFYGGEQVWNEPIFGAAGSGAPSLLFATPAYQTGLGLNSRGTPDISYNAAIDGGVLVYWSAVPSEEGFYIFGGTSTGSPQWAAIIALADQLSSEHHTGPLGFINPALYRLAESSAYMSDFHDITVGNNILAGTSVGFSAAPDWDDATGWGTPNVSNLIRDLVACVSTCNFP